MTDMPNTDEVEVPADIVDRFRHAREQIAVWQEIADEARAELERLMGEKDTATVDGCMVIRWTHVKSSRLDQSLVKSLHPAVHAECQTTSTSRRFTLLDGAS